MSPQKPIRLLCVDDHPILLQGLAALIATQPDLALVGQAQNGPDAIEQFRVQRPDVTLMDLRLPVLDGVTATRRILDEFRQARIVMLTTYAGDENIYQALEAGAVGYLLKDTLHAEVLDAIREVHAGHRYLPVAVAQRLAAHFPRAVLTEREQQVLRVLVRGLRNKEIAYELGISEDTARVHVQHILSKLQVTNRTEAVVVALQRGLLHLP